MKNKCKFLFITATLLVATTLSTIGFKKINNNKVNASADDLTVAEVAEFLLTKDEHYPLSDQFIEKHQQKSGGYLDNAKKAGIVVDKTQHSPNQKWHFFESWYYPSLQDGSLAETDKAKKRIYTNLLCPELLLWIYEACEVSPSKVRNAMKQAEQGKVEGKAVTSIAKSMRGEVSWDDCAAAILDAPVVDQETYSVTYTPGEGFNITGLNSKYPEGRDVTFTVNVTDSTKQIESVKANDESLTPVTGTSYKFKMPAKAVNITVTLKTKENTGGNPPVDEDFSDVKYNIVFDMGERKTSKQITDETELLNTFVLEGEGEDIISSISNIDYMYGGGYGGSGDSKWIVGNMLKFGTQAKPGKLTLNLKTNVSQVKITGYTNNTAGKIAVGNATVELTNMNTTTKENVEAGNTSSLLVNVTPTNTLTIEVIEKGPLYITSIEFVVAK